MCQDRTEKVESTFTSIQTQKAVFQKLNTEYPFLSIETLMIAF